MTKQAREELIAQMENDYEELCAVSSTLDNYIGNLVGSERTLPDHFEARLTQAYNILDECAGVLHSLIPDPEDS